MPGVLVIASMQQPALLLVPHRIVRVGSYSEVVAAKSLQQILKAVEVILYTTLIKQSDCYKVYVALENIYVISRVHNISTYVTLSHLRSKGSAVLQISHSPLHRAL